MRMSPVTQHAEGAFGVLAHDAKAARLHPGLTTPAPAPEADNGRRNSRR